MLDTQQLNKYISNEYEKLKDIAEKYGIYMPLSVCFIDYPSKEHKIKFLFCYNKDDVYHYRYFGARREESIYYHTEFIDDITYYAMFYDISQMSHKYSLLSGVDNKYFRHIYFSVFIELYAAVSDILRLKVLDDIKIILQKRPYNKIEMIPDAEPSHPFLLLPEYQY
jgi:hypothetical protein